MFKRLAPCNGIQDSSGFWIPRHGFRIRNLFQWNLDPGFQLSVGFRIPTALFRIPRPRIPILHTKISKIPDTTCKNFQDSGYYMQKFPRFRILLAKISKIPDTTCKNFQYSGNRMPLHGAKKAHRKWPSSPRGSLEAVVSVSPLAKREIRGRRARDPRARDALAFLKGSRNDCHTGSPPVSLQPRSVGLSFPVTWPLSGAPRNRVPGNEAGSSVTLWVHVSCRTLVLSFSHTWRKKHFVLLLSLIHITRHIVFVIFRVDSDDG